MGSFAEPCTEDMDPFMNTWTAACMPMRELFPNPVCGSPNPAGRQVFSLAAEVVHWQSPLKLAYSGLPFFS